MNDTETIIKYLKLYNEWRRGDEKMGQPNPAEIGKLIDEACEKLFLLERERNEAIAARKASASDWLSQVEQANSRTSRALQRVALAERERDEAKDALAAAKDKIKELEGQVSYARHERNKALNELDECKSTFDVRWQAQMRAVTRWQEETGKEIFWPGHEDLCLWLIRKLEAAK